MCQQMCKKVCVCFCVCARTCEHLRAFKCVCVCVFLWVCVCTLSSLHLSLSLGWLFKRPCQITLPYAALTAVKNVLLAWLTAPFVPAHLLTPRLDAALNTAAIYQISRKARWNMKSKGIRWRAMGKWGVWSLSLHVSLFVSVVVCLSICLVMDLGQLTSNSTWSFGTINSAGFGMTYSLQLT